MKTRFLHQITSALLFTAFSAHLSNCLAQGSLTPPGPPGATMVTLSQIEPRTPISSIPFTIYSGGDYYLTGNLYLATLTNAITVMASYVNIDLNGFALYGEAGGACAIAVSNNVQHLVVRNGVIDYWGTAVQGTSASSSTLENLRCYQTFDNALAVGGNSIVRGCVVNDPALSGGGDGILTGNNSLITDCIVLDDYNHYSYGIVVGNGCVIDSSITTSNYTGIITGDGTKLKGCSLLGNESYGLQTGSGCVVSDCTACGNSWGYTPAPGISTGTGCTITDCAANRNGQGLFTGVGSTIKDCTVISNALTGLNASVGCTISGCTANYNTNGIVANSECTIIGCTASANYVDGIQTAFSCLIKGNTCSSNSRYVITGGAGIHVLNSGNRIEGNVLNSNQYGIKADGTENFVIANTARSPGTYNYDLVSGNMVDTIINATASGAVTGPTGGTSLGTTDPWANFSF
jgi:parallel beta-helix repeat protein